MYCHGAKPKNLEVVGLPNGHDWSPADEDWHLPEGWKDIILNGMEDLMKKYRSFKLYMDVCVRCGACADNWRSANSLPGSRCCDLCRRR